MHSRPAGVGGEDPVGAGGGVGAAVEGRGRREEVAAERSHADLAAAVTAVEPDLVAALAAAREEVAGGEVLHRDAVGLEDLDPVAAQARRGPKSWSPAADEHFGEPGLVPSTTTRLRSRPRRWMSRRRDQDAGAGLVGRLVGGVVAALVVVARGDQDPVAGAGGVDGGLDRVELAVYAVP